MKNFAQLLRPFPKMGQFFGEDNNLQSPSLLGVVTDSLAQTSSGFDTFEQMVMPRFLGRRLPIPGAHMRAVKNARIGRGLKERCLMVADSAVADGEIFAVDIFGLFFSFSFSIYVFVTN